LKVADFRKRLKEGVVLFDGAIGTMLQQKGLEPGKPPETALLDNFDLVAQLHSDYAAAAADVITTNSFGANNLKLREYNLENRFEEINRRAVKAAKKGAGKAFVAGDLGPTGRFVEPVGDLKWGDAVEVYGKQARILADEGVDLFIIETMSDIRELKAAIIGVRAVSALPIIAMMTFDENGRSTLGTPPEVAAVVLEALRVDVIGSNCSVGPDGIAKWLEAMGKVVTAPLIAQPNAGLPRLEEGKTVFPLSPEDMAKWVEKFLELGCVAIGSCCGSTPAHTKAIARELDRLGRKWRGPRSDPLPGVTRMASRTKVVLIGPGLPPIAVGERINPTGKPSFSAELKNGDVSRVRNEARSQESNGAEVIDLNVGVPGVDEPALLREAVYAAESATSLPVTLDSADPKAIEEGLKACAGKPLINSVQGERKSMRELLPLAVKYGAAALGLCMDEKGVPETCAERIKIARRILKKAKSAGIGETDVLLDPVTVPVSADPNQPSEALAAIRYFSEKLRRGTLQGVSNISFGLPRRTALNAAYLAMAIEAGLNAAFVNPMEEKYMEIFYAAGALTGHDPAAKRYIGFAARMKGTGEGAASGKSVTKAELSWEDALKEAVINGDSNEVVKIVEAKLAQGIAPLEISDRALAPGIREVGRRFEVGEIFLPNLMLSAKAMEAGIALANRAMEKSVGEVVYKGVAVLATVEGDIHDIGKNIVATILRTNGWRVVDLGRSVSAEHIVREAEKEKADVVGLSALMTTTVVKMPEVIKLLKGKGVSVMVGGAVVTQDYAEKIGADFYGKDAMAALRGAEKLKTEKNNKEKER